MTLLKSIVVCLVLANVGYFLWARGIATTAEQPAPAAPTPTLRLRSESAGTEGAATAATTAATTAVTTAAGGATAGTSGSASSAETGGGGKPGLLTNVKWDPLESTCRHASLSIL